MAEESADGRKRDVKAPIWNDDRTAMIQYAGHDPDREFGGEIYDFAIHETSIGTPLSGRFVMRSISSDFDLFLERQGIDPLDHLRNVEFEDYIRQREAFRRTFGARLAVNRLFLNVQKIKYYWIVDFISRIFPVIWKIHAEYGKVYLYFNPEIRMEGMTQDLHLLYSELHGCYCQPELRGRCQERLCFDAGVAG